MKETIFEQVASSASVLKLDFSAEEFALCVLNEQGYCKKLKYDADGVYLVSLNPAYQPIPVQENDEFRIAGVVVG